MGQVFMTKIFRRFRLLSAEFCWLEGDDFELEEVGQKSRILQTLFFCDVTFCFVRNYCIYIYDHICIRTGASLGILVHV